MTKVKDTDSSSRRFVAIDTHEYRLLQAAALAKLWELHHSGALDDNLSYHYSDGTIDPAKVLSQDELRQAVEAIEHSAN